jgi:methyl-accepting chemotaxis protein
LHGTSEEIAVASLDLSSRTESAAASLEEQAASMEQIGATVGNMAERAKMAANFATSNAEVAEKGGKVIDSVVETMQNIHTSSAKINDIIGVINGIAFQTNILALNAAVEAARAGEAGRGFAVVASEVRSLAQRSAEAASQIKTLISNSVDQIASGTIIAEKAGSTMNTMVTNAKQMNTYINEISIATKEQADGVAQVALTIQTLDENTRHNAELVDQTAAASAALTKQAGSLQQEIGNFRVA